MSADSNFRAAIKFCAPIVAAAFVFVFCVQTIVADGLFLTRDLTVRADHVQVVNASNR